MRQRGLALAAASVLALAFASASSAAEIAVEGQVGYFRMAATNSGSALFGSDGGVTFGGAVRGTIWRGAFVSAGARTYSKSGERVFVLNPASPVQKLGFPLTMRTTPVFLSVGWRFRDGRTIVPYVSAGGAVAFYKQESDVAGQSFSFSRSKAGFVGSAGVEVGRGLLRFGAEIGYTTVPSAIGHGDVSQVYGEKDIGGLHAVGKLVLDFGEI